ncbi:putative membrane protein [Gottschalkia acidurici 9a]|uniref:Membrane protein n=1 Tax=Gottschalkia acidurici (strain ATCC 7906 / DSM 604 / BCRC 14475 / CIP 104303 / KCTC 5404 / NCIMB 10678 / 9a) TaxID=1128398 RepID=K0AYC4_GOTA9|nr:hypothetical protein [Gottschalkia acidurici]AFS78254.1 putative membrane protein [Gottschalkia acidurici 9a]
MSKSKKISIGAMITIISIVLLYLTSILTTTKIFLITLSSFLISVVVIEAGTSTALLSYASTAILSFILIPNKLMVIPYVILFGQYPITKYYVERLNNFVLEWIIKLLCFNVAVYINYIIFTMFISKDINIPLSICAIILALQVIFILYDYMFSRFISYYRNRIRKHLHTKS